MREEIQFIGAACSPLLVLLFAFEMTSLQDCYNLGILSERDMSVRVAYYVFKLPIGVLLPIFLNVKGALALAALSVCSIISIILEQRKINEQREIRENGGAGHD